MNTAPPRPPGPPPRPPQNPNYVPPQPVPTIEDITYIGLKTIEKRGRDGKLYRDKKKARFKRQVQNASLGKRFLHHLLDGVVFPLLIAFLYLELQYAIAPTPFPDRSILIEYYVSGLIYIFAFEWATGKSIGKYITGTIAINKYGFRVSPGEAGLRTLLRLIPFEPLSFIARERGWHDRFSETYVVKKKEMEELQILMREQFPDHPKYKKFDAKS